MLKNSENKVNVAKHCLSIINFKMGYVIFRYMNILFVQYSYSENVQNYIIEDSSSMCWQFYSNSTLQYSTLQVTVEMVVLAFHLRHYLKYQSILTHAREIGTYSSMEHQLCFMYFMYFSKRCVLNIFICKLKTNILSLILHISHFYYSLSVQIKFFSWNTLKKQKLTCNNAKYCFFLQANN